MARAPRSPFLTLLALVASVTVGASGCVPYSVGATAATVAPREIEPSTILQVTSGRRDLLEDDEPKGAGLMLGNEARLGLDARSDVGVRIVGLGSVTATYKRRLAGLPGQDAGVSLLVGAGVVGATHLHAEATLVASPGPLAPASQIVPYGAIRLQDLTAFAPDALGSAPALGLVIGGRFGWPDLAVSPELGVFYSPSPFAGDDDLILVPSVTVRGDRLRKALGI